MCSIALHARVPTCGGVPHVVLCVWRVQHNLGMRGELFSFDLHVDNKFDIGY